ncbi:MAG TPA: MmcQ/YjbR family DNA-binding protein [Chloroflexota bacterium]|nr:MmcQ/YjbR family DNA-binding protein [Chloroflexota bacterium]
MITAEEVRDLALSLPEAAEIETWGEATFRVRNKIFLILSPNGDGASLRTSLDQQLALTSAFPEAFSVAHYVGRFGWVSVRLNTVDQSLMSDLVIDVWRRTAPKRVVARFDADQQTTDQSGQ